MTAVDIVQKFVCTGCDVIAIMGNANQQTLFPYDKNRTPRCAKCGMLARRFCDCGQTFPYNGKVKVYQKHLFVCEQKKADEEARLELEREMEEVKKMLSSMSLNKVKKVKQYIQETSSK